MGLQRHGMIVSFRTFILWLHLLAAMTWIGGLIFQLLVVVPTLRKPALTITGLRLQLRLETRFRSVMWPAVGLVLFTGLVNILNVWHALTQAGVSAPPGFMWTLSLKLLLVLGMVVLQAGQQFLTLPRRMAILGSLTSEVQELPPTLYLWQRRAVVLYSATVSLGLVVVLCALLLRG